MQLLGASAGNPASSLETFSTASHGQIREDEQYLNAISNKGIFLEEKSAEQRENLE